MLIGNYFDKIKKKHKSHFFSGLSFNSSKCKKNYIFFAIKGNKIDGNQYIQDAIKNGARTIISNNNIEELKDGVLYINSKNVRKLLSEISYKYYKDIPKNLIAVTGTNGKSSIADLYFQILKHNKKKVASIGTLGIKTIKGKKFISNTTLDPIKLGFELRRLKRLKINNVILEASSHGLKQNRLDGLNFNIGIFTNLSHDHLDYHKSLKDYLNSKLYLFEKLLKDNSCLITDNTIPEYSKIKKIALKKKADIKTVSNNKSDLCIVLHKYLGEKQLVKIKYKNNFYTFSTNLIGKIQIKNMLMSMAAANKSNIKFEKIISIANKLKPVYGRLEKVGKINNSSLVILDFAHTPHALETCLQNLKEQFLDRKISIVFGCGGERDRLKRPKMGQIANYYCDKIFLTDDNPRSENPQKIRLDIKKKINKSKLFEIPDREKAIKEAIYNLRTGEILVVAGKGHENTQYYKDSSRFFSDKHFILKNIKYKNKKLSKDLKLNIIKEESGNKDFFCKKKIKNASINSKEVKKNDVFFAIKGKKYDGNLFLKEAFKKGAILAVVDKIDKKINKSKQIKVKDTLSFLTKNSSIIRDNSLAKIIAITGSCGKTSLKELLGKVLKKFSNTIYSKKSFNNKFGVPLSLFNLDKNIEYGVFEVGMDKKGEIDLLTNIIKPDIGVITNVSYAHAKNFKNLREIAFAKAEIIQNIKEGGDLVLNADDKFFNLHKNLAFKKNINVHSFSVKKQNSNIQLNNIKKIGNRFKLKLSINKKIKYFFVSSIFDTDIKNILAAITIISIFKDIINLDINIFYKQKPPTGRGDISKVRVKDKSFFLIDESYNSNPLSLRSAIKNFNMIKVNNSKKHLILGDMLELGSHSKKLHLEVTKNINSTSIDRVNVIGRYIKETYKNIHKSKKGIILNEISEIFDLIKSDINNNDYLMIKGSNATELHKVSSHLKKGKTNAL